MGQRASGDLAGIDPERHPIFLGNLLVSSEIRIPYPPLNPLQGGDLRRDAQPHLIQSATALGNQFDRKLHLLRIYVFAAVLSFSFILTLLATPH